MIAIPSIGERVLSATDTASTLQVFRAVDSAQRAAAENAVRTCPTAALSLADDGA
jgi:ferredoxin